MHALVRKLRMVDSFLLRRISLLRLKCSEGENLKGRGNLGGV